ncbi:ComF family protein [Noviherbaspirillum sp. CPCC 100848]|uniref:ComF family protein n=1 Tax=Noviherbaspirillum album TaxID=3080276 RepID=A0ABU6J613_9BURK|nr:ComF family protein [Noviherbaspirillum sp. CPCC 100848]MEC4719078.1 ComF family protein [Noviherbaspirillum sp. CPCC 100848]
MLSSLRHLSRSALAGLPLLLPASCALCGASARDNLCGACKSRFFGMHAPRCRSCAMALPQAAGKHEICGQCLRKTPSFDATVVACNYTAPHDRLALGLKFGGSLQFAPLMAAVIRDAMLQQDKLELPQLLAVVPLGNARLAERGFNQALEIARPLSRMLGVPLQAQLLLRQRETRAQSLLHPDERQKNVRGAFVVSAQSIDLVRGRHVGMVDDVMTTGDTLNEVAATLKRFGAARVTNFVFARTPQH